MPLESAKVWKLTAQIAFGPTSRSTLLGLEYLDEIEKETGGRVKFVKRFTNHSFVPSERVLPALAESSLHFHLGSAFPFAGIDPVPTFTNIPGWFVTRDARVKAFADPEIMAIIQAAWHKLGCHFVRQQCIAEQVWAFTKKLKGIDDMNGLRIIGSGGMFNDLVVALGASREVVPPAGRYEALMRGVAEGVEGSIYMFDDYKYGEPLVQVMLPPWIEYQDCDWICGKWLWDEFPEDIKAAIHRAGERCYKNEVAACERYKKYDNPKIIEKYNLDALWLSAEDLAKLHKACDAIAEKFAKSSLECEKLVEIWKAKHK